MKRIIKISTAASLFGLGLTLAACDAPAEDAMEDKAEAIDERADELEDADVITDAQEESMEERADAIEDTADEVDPGTVTDETTPEDMTTEDEPNG